MFFKSAEEEIATSYGYQLVTKPVRLLSATAVDSQYKVNTLCKNTGKYYPIQWAGKEKLLTIEAIS